MINIYLGVTDTVKGKLNNKLPKSKVTASLNVFLSVKLIECFASEVVACRISLKLVL